MSGAGAVRPDIQADFDKQGLMRHFGARLVEAGEGRCIVEVEHRPTLTQQHGFFHAGVAAALADSAAGYAALSTALPGSSVLSVEFKLNLLAPADGEQLRATAEVVKAGRRLVTVSAAVDMIRNGEPERCAQLLGTMTVRRAGGS